ncbi:SpoVK/Ycf46/Vps4 family AAA+-type ATPase [Tahibacter aquaticus]|uniref:SpoVK/Ycf46/Vps4 family AAA+-type ATPase n=1 Tax=Tahibacter aquaticus TaxID=520092 RepID=A0A4R6Z304_9GAMM|nr:ATP-binding protein [Tahibacter aquaticus]TDR45859.1 SpoVK/Ycf46/Vps4 family AAA+-type ATPase [Tahibacter aquaticus]
MQTDQLDGLERALAASPDNLPLAELLLGACADANEHARACRVLDGLPAAALAALPLNLRLRLSRLAGVHGDNQRALQLAGDETPEAGIARVRALLALNRREEAEREYRRAVQANPTLEDERIAAELRGKVVSLDAARRFGAERTVAADEIDGDDVVRRLAPETERIGFADVGGLDAVKQQIRRRIITPFQKPSLFERFRRKAGGGILMYGPPGCGKTLLARATAGECGAKFFNIAIEDVLDMWMGESERKLHALFDQARRSAPAVMFFDEIEALGGKREYSREATTSKLVSQFLAELDGFAQNNQGVLILGATNVPWAVDPAFRRPGRFDRVLFVPPPDQTAREDILRGLLKGRPLAAAVDIAGLARSTSAFSGADLRHLVDTAVDEAIDASLAAGDEVALGAEHLKAALSQVKPTTLEWLTTARNYARYANEGGQYDDVLEFIRQHGKN